MVVGGENVYEVSASLQQNRLVYSQLSSNVNLWRLDLKNPARPIQLISSTQESYLPRFSPDGKKIVFESNRSGSHEVWVCDSDGANPVQLTFFGDALTGAPCWSPDGNRLAFDSRSPRSGAIYLMNADGGNPQRLTTESFDAEMPSWSRDGHWVYFASNQTGIKQVWKIPADGGDALQVTQKGGAVAFESSDGKFIYYTKSDSIWRLTLEGGEERAILGPLYGDFDLAWTVTEKGIYFINHRMELVCFNFATQSVRRITRIEKTPHDWGLAVSPDERWIMYAQVDHRDADIALIENFR